MAKSVNVSILSIIFMTISAVLSFCLPIAAVIFMGVKKRLNWKAMLVGSLLFVIFALILENIMHSLVLGTVPGQSAIYNKPILYMIYGGFAAGIFEETGRLLGFKIFIKVKDNESINTAVSYGLGHGGIEAIFIGGLSALSNIVTSVMLNSGAINAVRGAMKGEELDAFNKVIDTLITTPSHLFLMPGVERMTALLLQIALSVFVFKAVTEKSWKLFVYAVLIHAGVDMIAILYQRGFISNLFLLEGVLLLASTAVAAAAFKISKAKPVKKQTGLE